MKVGDRRFDDWVFERQLTAAKAIFTEQKQMVTMLTAYNRKGECTVVALPFDDEIQKSRMLSLLRMVYGIYEIEHYLGMSECWMVSEDERKECEPRLHPNRKEALMVWSCNHDRRRYGVYWIERKGGDVKLVERYQTRCDLKPGEEPSVSGRMVELLPPRGMRVSEALRADLLAMAQEQLGVEAQEVDWPEPIET